ncbi:MAG: Rieske 2Fe-2S domain-containing protein [Myxococcota bacterium]
MRDSARPFHPSSRYPFTAFPDGWYHIAKSADLAVGEVRPIRVLGQDLVLARTESGRALVFEAHCPHLGAHLGFGGRIEGEQIICPFHAWRFGSDGRCTGIPYQHRGTLPKVGLRTLKVDERSGLILVWHSDDDTAPSWHMRDIPEYDAPDWLGYTSRSWTIRMHVQELAENVPDSAHFEVIHGLPSPPTAEPRVDGPVYYQNTAIPGGAPDGGDWLFAQQEAWGLGLVWLRTLQEPSVFFVTATTPIDEERCELTQHLMLHDVEGRGEIGPAQRKFIEDVFSQTDADVPIWENKVYRDRPPLIEDDGPLPVLRRWARQFYPEFRD